MPSPGIYLINSTGETVPLLTERDDEGDEQLLREVLDEHDFVQHPDLDIVLDIWEESHGQYIYNDYDEAASELRKCYNDVVRATERDRGDIDG